METPIKEVPPMRNRPDDPFWVVTNPGPEATLADIVFSTTLRGLKRQFDGGLSLDDDPTLYDSEEAALRDAGRRLLCRRVTAAIASTHHDTSHVAAVRLLDRDGVLQAEIELP
jgi:hypothetical protein